MKLTTEGAIPDEYVEKLADFFNYLVDREAIKYGCLGPAIAIKLADLYDKNGAVVRDNSALVIVHVFSDHDRQYLNRLLGNEAFIEEGGMGNDDWDLPTFCKPE